MNAHRAEFPLTVMCRVLGLSTSGYYDWKDRAPSERERRDEALQGRIEAVWRESRDTHGRLRIHAALLAQGERVARSGWRG